MTHECPLNGRQEVSILHAIFIEVNLLKRMGIKVISFNNTL